MASDPTPFLDRVVTSIVRVPDATTPAQQQRAATIAQGLKGLRSMGIVTVRDLLAHTPRRYLDRSVPTDLAAIVPGEEVTVIAHVDTFTSRRAADGRMIVISVMLRDDRGGRLAVSLFTGSAYMARDWERLLRPGALGLFTGPTKMYRNMVQLTSPDWELLDEDTEYSNERIAQASDLITVYRGKGKVTSRAISHIVRDVVGQMPELDDADPIPAAVRKERNLVSLAQGYRLIHQPRNFAQKNAGQRRAKFEEAFILQAELARRRADIRSHKAIARHLRPGRLLDAFDDQLPFPLTSGQLEVGGTLAADIAGTTPMLRLLQGDVGAGKTVVALRAMLQVVDAGGQAALLAPTEVLAAQHAASIGSLMGDLARGGTLMAPEPATRVTLLTGSLGAAARKKALLDIASGQAGIVVGTHALLGDQVHFADLGLVVVDEQHRFGVDQRDALRARGETVPHTLVMTATPIPRTVAMTVFGDLEVSVLRGTPARSHDRATFVVDERRPRWMERTWQRLADEIRQGRRGFVVCPRIDPGEAVDSGEQDQPDQQSDIADEAPRDLHSVEQMVQYLGALPALAGVRIAALHGRMNGDEKDAIMAALAAGSIDVVVSTTVIEVGIDVPEATIMVVMDADRFGISQLHQLRGRVGRGQAPGICLLVSPVAPDSPAGKRIAAVAASDDGFELANVDVTLRREGDVLGQSQAGYASSLRSLRVIDDAQIIAQARADARAIVQNDPTLEGHRALAAAIAEMLAGRAEFIERA
ncbi:ATP-dependent DNA helicase RecG [Rarobacter incanus]|uniref:Probable DNA 3'-5' helicase RecG n=1 Tax=Rarobacter incanus TaxID=153494 RepID=A0A542SN45_9MICO|nr:ATP-dependent DNA helicase RecG [Rarobacter incanus]TQK76051.1 ATP-dependent DNA helicase RecG [Rarobacter incanus]